MAKGLPTAASSPDPAAADAGPLWPSRLGSWGGPGVSGEHLRDLFLVLTAKELKVRYKGSWLGYLWSVANPLAFALIYVLAFGVVMRVDIPRYPLFLIAGLFPWHWLAHTLSAAPTIFLANAPLVKKVRFPRQMLVAATVLNGGLHLLLSVPVIAACLLWSGLGLSWTWLVGLPLLLGAQFLLVYGAALAVASVNLFFRDLDRLTGLLVTFLFFLTPIAYSIDMVPEPYRGLVPLNPVAPLMLAWQELFLRGVLAWPLVGLSVAYGLAVCGLGSLAYRRLAPRFAEVL